MTKTDAAFEELRQLIYAGKLRAGQRLPVSELVELLKMSPTPIREALRLLQAAGLVEHQSHHGMVVRTHVEPDQDEIYELRAALEPLAAERAARTATQQQLAEIAGAHQQLRTLAASRSRTTGALEKITASHQRLFTGIFAASNSELLVGFIDDIRSGMKTKPPMHQWEETLDEQSEIVQAILNRDPKQARKAMSAYLAHVRSLAGALAKTISKSRPEKTVESLPEDNGSVRRRGVVKGPEA